MVHRLVCEAFHGPQPTKYHEVAHWDGDRLNNAPSNVRWATHKENEADKIRHGKVASGDRNGRRLHPERYPRGERHPMSKLTDVQVSVARQVLAADMIPMSDVAILLGISYTQIKNIKKGKHRKCPTAKL